jgi:hypothetical protein
LWGAERPERRFITSAAFSFTMVRGDSSAKATIAGAPPEKASTPPRGVTIAGSAGRTDRTGPTLSASVDWNTTTKRVMPSVYSSKTTSALSMPPWGRAAALLSIFTVTAGRAAAAGSVTGLPVSGKTGGRVVDVVVSGVFAAFLESDEHPLATTVTAMVRTSTARPPTDLMGNLIQSSFNAWMRSSSGG